MKYINPLMAYEFVGGKDSFLIGWKAFMWALAVITGMLFIGLVLTPWINLFKAISDQVNISFIKIIYISFFVAIQSGIFSYLGAYIVITFIRNSRIDIKEDGIALTILSKSLRIFGNIGFALCLMMISLYGAFLLTFGSISFVVTELTFGHRLADNLEPIFSGVSGLLIIGLGAIIGFSLLTFNHAIAEMIDFIRKKI